MTDENKCTLPPPGWYCTRGKHSEGPCAAVPMTNEWDQIDRGVIRIGFTGTRKGMTVAQKAALTSFLSTKEFIGVHGCARGADAEFDAIARLSPGFRAMELHPSNIPAEVEVVPHPNDVKFGPAEPLARNRTIIARCELLLGAPAEQVQRLRSGTWATIRGALKAHGRVVLFFPNGSVV